jgi:plastocyanin
VVTIGGERYVVRGDNVLVPAGAYFDPGTVTVQAGSVVTYDGQPRVVEEVDADGVQLTWRAERTTETQLAPGETVTLAGASYVVHIADGARLQPVADRSVVAAQTAQIAAFERLISGLWGVFIVSVLSVVFLAGFAFLPRRY